MERQLTELERAKEELRRANERFGLAAEAVNGIIYDWDIEKNKVERMQGLSEILGYRQEETEPTFDWWLTHLHPDDQQRVRDQISAAFANSSVFVIEYRFRNKDNQYLYIWERGLIVRNVDGRAVRVVGSMLDISDRWRVEAEIRQQNETLEQRVLELTAQLEAANKELNSFSYSISHDLGAPLRHISGFVDALAQKLEHNGAIADPKVAHFLKIIQDSSQKMGQMIESLLTLSRLGRQRIASQPVNLRQLVDTAIALVLSQTETGEDRPIEFTIGELPSVSGDPTLLQQVFSNLIDNAVKFSRERRPAKIVIGTLADGTIFVTDNGVGFQMKYADQLFGVFQRLHSLIEFQGMGIGLAIVQRIIHRHGGTIWAESAPNQGATFYFSL